MTRSALILLIALAAALPAQAQRLFERNALRGELVIKAPPEVLLNGKPARLTPGARIHNAQNMLQLSGSLLEQKLEESTKMFQCVKVTLLASLNGYAPALAVEFGRKVLYSTERPSFSELEEHIKKSKSK